MPAFVIHLTDLLKISFSVFKSNLFFFTSFSIALEIKMVTEEM